MIPNHAFVSTLGLLIGLMLPVIASAAGPPSQVTLDLTRPELVRQSGEVRLMLADLIEVDEHIYALSVTFPNEQAQSELERLGIRTLDLADFDNIISMDPQGKLIEQQAAGLSLIDVGVGSSNILCGNVVARGSKEISPGIWLGVSLHRGFQVQGVDEFVNDVFEDCDYFAWGGCGDKCYNLTVGEHWGWATVGWCREVEVWGPNTCTCKDTGIIE